MRGPIAAIAALALVSLAPAAQAQMPGPGMPTGAQQQVPPCFNEFAPLRAEAEERAKALKALMETKPTREEACASFKHFSAAEAKIVKFVSDNAQQCGIPPEATAQIKANHSRTIRTQNQICNAGGTGPRVRMTAKSWDMSGL